VRQGFRALHERQHTAGHPTPREAPGAAPRAPAAALRVLAAVAQAGVGAAAAGGRCHGVLRLPQSRVQCDVRPCRNSLLAYLCIAQMLYDVPAPTDQIDELFKVLCEMATAAAAKPLAAPADLEYAQAIATFDDGVFTLALFPDVRGCADSAAYRSEAVAKLARVPGLFTKQHREAESLARSDPAGSQLDHFIILRDAEHVAEAARRLVCVQWRGLSGVPVVELQFTFGEYIRRRARAWASRRWNPPPPRHPD